ncbi:MAG: 2-dehydro-3-deoxy-D-gluconate 5-dehydrogenase KduD [Hyphomicrobiales bacterium]|nr:2-dehydro-3-deoxy-D-gluconate 5-dehydrogenase KduD [Hyphomicrobiales bacterium]
MSDLSAFDLSKKRIVVTGANAGIGQGIAVALAGAGAEIIGVGRSSMAETAETIAAMGGRCSDVTCDLSDRDAVRRLIDDVWQTSGPLDGLVNNAGIIRRDDSTDLSEQDWDDVLDVNLTAVFQLSRAFGRRVLQAARRGKIINIASILSFQGGIRVASYTASKHGIAGLTKVMANDWAAKGINVNAIAPGYIETKNTAALRNDPQRSRELLSRIPAGRFGQSAEIGDAAVFLMAPASDYVHGAILPVDGGWLAR